MLCAVLCWSGAALRLKDRDDWIGWDPLARGSRLPLVTQLRRFVVVDARREPNLATRCVGLALRKLPKSLALDGKDLGHALGAIV